MTTSTNVTYAPATSLDDMVASIVDLMAKLPPKPELWSWSMMPPGRVITVDRADEVIVLANPSDWRKLGDNSVQATMPRTSVFYAAVTGIPVIDLDKSPDDSARRRATEIMLRHFFGQEGSGL